MFSECVCVHCVFVCFCLFVLRSKTNKYKFFFFFKKKKKNLIAIYKFNEKIWAK